MDDGMGNHACATLAYVPVRHKARLKACSCIKMGFVKTGCAVKRDNHFTWRNQLRSTHTGSTYSSTLVEDLRHDASLSTRTERVLAVEKQ